MHTTYTSHGIYFFYLYFPFFISFFCRFFVNKKHFVDTQKLYLYINSKSKITHVMKTVWLTVRKNVDDLMVS